MKFELAHALEVLERTPCVLRAMLSGLSDAWLHGTCGPDTFSPFDVVGHLIVGEKTDWMVRLRLILTHGPARPFERYDRYAQFESSRGNSIAELLDEFERLRATNLREVRGLSISAADLDREGMHPALGRVTLRQLLSTWTAHDLNHLAQIAKALATQYEDQVGPWRAYLGVLKHPATKMDAEGIARRRAAKADAGTTP